MLNLVWLSRQAFQKSLFREFDPARQTWVVSDRKSEFFLTRDLLQRYEIINEPVKRARDLWQQMLEESDTQVRVLEALGARIQARDFLLSAGTSEWCKRPRAPQKLLEACETLAPLMAHPQATEILDDYFATFKQTAGPFLEIARLGVKFYRRSIAQKKLPRFFVPYFLADQSQLCEGRDFIFDLGFELRDGERELIQRLSRSNQVTVIIPARDEAALEEKGLYAYRNFEVGLAQVSHRHVDSAPVATGKTEVNNLTESTSAEIELWRCSSPEAEARKAVEQVAGLVNAGVKADRICITAANIGDYENLLSHDFDWEGIGLQRTLKTRLSASRLFRALDARLQIVNGAMTAAILDEAFLTVAPYKHSLRRRRERRVLKPIMHQDQVPQAEIQGAIAGLRSRKHKDQLTLIEFEDLLVTFFSELVGIASQYENPAEAESRNGLFMMALKKMRTELGHVTLDFALWIEAWQEITNGMRMNYKQAFEGGVWAVDTTAAEETPADYLIILGAAEDAGRNSIVAGLGDEKIKFFNQLGFDFSSSNRRKHDPQVAWLMTGAQKKIILSCSKTDSRGRSVAASGLWIKMASEEGRDLEKLDFARHTRWVDVQKTILTTATAQKVDVFKGWAEGTAQQTGMLVAEELTGTRKVVVAALKADPLPLTLSASRIESYFECPFKFFSTAILGLFDEADLEVEPSPQVRGQWLHAAVERIMGAEKKLETWTDPELAALVDSLDEVQRQVSSDVWVSIRSRFVRQLKRFITFEIDWAKKYPRAKPAGLEARLSGFLEWPRIQSEIKFLTQAPTKASNDAPGGVATPGPAAAEAGPEKFWAPFKGSIDRVDLTAEGKAVILDYKNSSSAASNILSWAKQGSFQLALYAEAVEAGLLDRQPHRTIAAQYYALRNPQRDKGFKLIDEDLIGILPTDSSSKADVDGATRDLAFGEINALVHDVLEKIRQGEMTPLPQNEKLCAACSWRTSCRATHLS